MPTKIICTSCGACCKSIGQMIKIASDIVANNPGHNLIEQYKEMVAFPHPVTDQGACSQLLPDGTCADYTNRPNICNSEYVYDTYYKATHTLQEYISANAAVCNKLIALYNLPDTFLINL